MGIFDTLTKEVGGLFGGSTGGVLGIDISASSIKVVQLRKSGGRAVLDTYGELALGPYAGREVGQATNLSESKVIEALGDILREAKTTTKKCGVSIPLSASFLTNISFPTVDEKQLKEVIPIEARKYIPVPIAEVLLDWYIIPDSEFGRTVTPEDGKRKQTEALVVAIHKETIGKYQNIIKKLELETTFFEIEIFSTIRSVVDRGIEPILVVDFGASSTKLFVVKSGVVLASHTINRGSQEITLAIANTLGIDVAHAEQVKRTYEEQKPEHIRAIGTTVSSLFDYIFFETGQVVANFQKKYGQTVSKVILTGGGALFHGIKDLAQEKFDAEVTLADPFQKVKTPAFLEDILKKAGPEFAVAIGLALRKLEERN